MEERNLRESYSTQISEMVKRGESPDRINAALSNMANAEYENELNQLKTTEFSTGQMSAGLHSASKKEVNNDEFH